MARKNISWKTKGMNRDISVSSFNAELAFENVNLRLATQDGNTMMSWVNEKGPSEIKITEITQAWDDQVLPIFTIQGTVIGTAVINHQLVLFTTVREVASLAGSDRIYVFKYDDEEKTSMSGTFLFQGNLNFSIDYPIETMVAYESSYIQKVYWTDNRNQPRLINIAASKDKVAKWHSTTTSQKCFFDFVPVFNMEEENVAITKNTISGGLFAPGVIQYVFTYLNKYGQESNIAYQSTLYYLSHSDRGASPEDKVSSSFTITINNADSNFDYVRIYSIQRTSLNTTPFAKRLDDLPIIEGDTITYVDNGTTGATIDPTELLYIGGKEIKALTMVDKDNTLFMGNITQVNSLVTSIQDYYDELREGKSDDPMGITFKTGLVKKVTNDHAVGIYSYTNELNNNHREISTFKGGETYRFGFQLQKKTGEWVEPIFMNDVENTLYPNTSITKDDILLPYAEAEIPIEHIAELYNAKRSVEKSDFYSIFKSIRPVIVYPSIEDRSVLCQGVINPTVFNVEDRIDNSPFAQASWFFRPYVFSNSEDRSSSSSSSATNLAIKVSHTTIYNEEEADATITRAIPSDFADNDLLEEIYVLTASIPVTKSGTSTVLDTILSRGYLIYHLDETVYVSDDEQSATKIVKQDIEIPFSGAIILGKDNADPSLYRCAFISSSPFRVEILTDTKNGYYHTGETSKVVVNDVPYDEDNPDKYSPAAYKFYKDMEVTTSSNLYYYPSQKYDVGNYIFMFKSRVDPKYENKELYKVLFPVVGKDTYVPESDTSGNSLRFAHYDSLYTLDDIDNADDTPTKGKYLEIEGAVRTYDSVFTDAKTKKHSKTTNTQFFVDQSILTLNSPDIEFDTEVQSYGWEGLHLRLVGAIPITSYQSSHAIDISTEMLETGHNADDTSISAQFGAGEKSTNTIHNNVSSCGGQRMIADYLWNDVIVTTDKSKTDGVVTKADITDFLVYPWQKTGSLNNDTRAASTTKDGDTYSASSYLEKKREGHLSYSLNSVYLANYGLENREYEYLNTQVHLTENAEVMNMRLGAQKYDTDQINYYPNIDKVLINSNGYKAIVNYGKYSVIAKDWNTTTRPVSIKYMSTSHAVIALKAENQGAASTHTSGAVDTDIQIPIMPYATIGSATVGQYTNSEATQKTFWGKKMQFIQGGIALDELFAKRTFDFLWLVELYKDVEESSRFGGKGKSAVLGNKWLVGGEAQRIYAPSTESTSSNNNVILRWTEGDTFYQRYDCLKTYPFTKEDPNQVTEILSFMCESHINLDGRYDKNRGQLKNYLMRPENFNLLNYVYSQQNNFFTSRKLDVAENETLSYPNHIYYSKTKESGADVDLWTNVTLATTLEMDGDKGGITSLNRLNDQIIAFQNSGIAQVLFNENTQISTTEGVPIEIANSGKVQGKRYLSNTIGCSNKWSIVQTPSGIYFMDNNDKSIYLFNGQLANLSFSKGFDAWAKQNIPTVDDINAWNPSTFKDFRTVYDKLNQEVLFINKDKALSYSEKFGMFTSFYDYSKAPYFENLDDTGIWVRDNKLWKHQAGDYCNFFGANKPYSMTLIASQEPQLDKIFTNLEFRACVEGEGTYDSKTEVFTPTLPFDSLEVWNEYQHGTLSLTNGNNKAAAKHGNDSGVLSRKYRMWRCDIPRDNAPIDETTEAAMGIKRFKVRPLDRIRNPWVYLKLKKDAATNDSLSKVEIHDIMATYFA